MNFKNTFYLHKYNLLKPGSLAYFRQLMANEKKSRAELEELQWQKTYNLIRHAATHSPFYRRRLQEIGAEIVDFRSADQFDRFPVLTRDDLQQHFNDILCDNAKRAKQNLSTTGGSSGQPATVLMPKSFPRAALGWRMLLWWGISPVDNWARTYRETALNLSSRLKQRLIDYPVKTLLLNASSFTEADIANFLNRFNQLHPPLLQGYVGAIDTVAEYILNNNIQVFSPKAVWVTSAPLNAIQRSKIERAFHSQVFDQYGCCEVYWLAAECQAHRGLHMFYDARRIDFLGQDYHAVPAGLEGEIAVTDLENLDFPIIRYLNGDRGRQLVGNCSCGCNLPLMDHVKGRISDTIKLPSGRCINGEFVTTLFDQYAFAVKRFHVHQYRDFSIVLSVVPACGDAEMQKILQTVEVGLRASTFNEVKITVQTVPEIKLIKGKLRYITTDI